MSLVYRPTDLPLRENRCNLKLKEQHKALFHTPYSCCLSSLLDEFDLFMKHPPASLAAVRETEATSSAVSRKDKAKSADWTIWVSRPVLDRFHRLKKLSGATSHADFVDMLLNMHAKSPSQVSTPPQSPVHHRPRPIRVKTAHSKTLSKTEPTIEPQTPSMDGSKEFRELITQLAEDIDSGLAAPDDILQVTPPEPVPLYVYPANNVPTPLPTMQNIIRPHVPTFVVDPPTMSTEPAMSIFDLDKTYYDRFPQQFDNNFLYPFDNDRSYLSPQQPMQVLPTPSRSPVDVLPFLESNSNEKYLTLPSHQVLINTPTLPMNEEFLQSLEVNRPIDGYMDDNQLIEPYVLEPTLVPPFPAFVAVGNDTILLGTPFPSLQAPEDMDFLAIDEYPKTHSQLDYSFTEILTIPSSTVPMPNNPLSHPLQDHFDTTEFPDSALVADDASFLPDPFGANFEPLSPINYQELSDFEQSDAAFSSPLFHSPYSNSPI
ncbi:uncharacterized protein BJ171DRAFT_598092 [Polychytrium aggregatum]|uniref:uncharacterized protein n=1 Tax=Polychytrium aggregatum TaxID=110093 RepID=UPI0022FE04BE|nr:uncharacterized protein BJ171DRAFT_598092 [Polychytrium aggregatum]KAI9205905.1 hypothetical protein BJ171DRAFT_598092 [Polychytrium aggregatum]